MKEIRINGKIATPKQLCDRFSVNFTKLPAKLTNKKLGWTLYSSTTSFRAALQAAVMKMIRDGAWTYDDVHEKSMKFLKNFEIRTEYSTIKEEYETVIKLVEEIVLNGDIKVKSLETRADFIRLFDCPVYYEFIGEKYSERIYVKVIFQINKITIDVHGERENYF